MSSNESRLLAPLVNAFGDDNVAAAPYTVPADLKEIQVRFVTTLPYLAPTLPTSQFAVPVKLTRYGLSEVVNHLGAVTPPRPFDVLYHDQFVRTDLLKLLVQHRLNVEEIVTLRVVEALPAPRTLPPLPQPDWISSVHAPYPTHIVTACYDGVVRVLSADAAAASSSASSSLSLSSPSSSIFTSPHTLLGKAHVNAVKCVRMTRINGELHVVSASKDQTVRLWHVNDTRCSSIAVGKAHTDSVDTVEVLSGTSKFVSGGWDKLIYVWDARRTSATQRKESGEAAPHAKRSKTASTSSSSSSSSSNLVKNDDLDDEPVLVPITSFGGHTDVVTSLVSPFPSVLFSASLDSSIRQYDIERGIDVKTWHGHKSIVQLSINDSGNLLATAHQDRVVRVWDTRKKGA